MKLTDLNPRWISSRWEDAQPNVKFGITFECPHCRKQRLAIFFKPEIGTINSLALWAVPTPSSGNYWTRSGETFETISLMPSVDASVMGHWHGFITNGEVK